LACVENLPFLTVASNCPVRHERTVTRKHVARPEVAHEANTVQEVCTLALLDQDCDKILVGIELDALATAHQHAVLWAA
jgi:hypothetical protein